MNNYSLSQFALFTGVNPSMFLSPKKPDGYSSQAKNKTDVKTTYDNANRIFFQEEKTSSGSLNRIWFDISGKECSVKDALVTIGRCSQLEREEIKAPFLAQKERETLRVAAMKHLGVNNKINEIQEKYGVQISFEDNNSGSTKEQFSHIMLRKLNELDKEMEKYPPGFIKNSGLKKILISQKILNNPNMLGVYYSLPRSNYLTVVDPTFAFDHEFYHFLDLNDKDERWGIGPFSMHFDDSSKFYNAHGGKGKYYSDINCPHCINRPKGFARLYGTTNVVEDKATIAESTLNEGDNRSLDNYGELKNRALYDPSLSAKIEIIQHEYFRWSGGLMDKDFFEKIKDGQSVDSKYWEARGVKNISNPVTIGNG